LELQLLWLKFINPYIVGKNMKHLTILLAVISFFSLPAQAQEFPSKPVRVTSPFPVGSGPDVVVRMLSEKLQSYWSQSVVVDTKAGANGVIAIDQTKRSNPDGHDLLILDNGHATIIPNLYKKLSYDVDRDLAPITLVMSVPFFVTTASDGPIKSVSDLISASKAKPGAISYGTPFIGSPAHLGSALFESMSATKMINTPFKETSQLFTSVANGNVTWALGTFATTGPFVRSGKLKLLAVGAPKRSSSAPDVPTVDEEAKFSGFEVISWVGLFAPIGTPPTTLDKINRDFARALNETDIRQKMMSMGIEATPSSRGDFSKVINQDTKKYGDLIKSTDIKVD